MKSKSGKKECTETGYPADGDYTRLTPLMMLQLAAPHTWPAAIIPVLFAASLAAVWHSTISITLTLALLIICILMQAAVNTINDYFDFIKGTDSRENQDDPTDAVLVYNNIDPKHALYLTIAFLLAGFLIGIYVILHAGWIPLAIGAIGALIIILYSAGKSPLSYLPVGEYVSGITMGGLISLASYQVLTGIFDLMILVLALPIVCGIGLIMFTNNTCDIEKDIVAGRKTQSVLLGREKAVKAYHGVMFFWIFSIIVLVALFFTEGCLILPFMLFILQPGLSMLYKNPLKPETRGPAMGACLNANIGLGAFYVVAILFSGISSLVF